MKSNRQTPGSTQLLIDAAAQAAGRGSGLPNLLKGNRPILGGFITPAPVCAGPVRRTKATGG